MSRFLWEMEEQADHVPNGMLLRSEAGGLQTAEGRVRLFKDAWVDAEGFVLLHGSCKAFRNGGCYRRGRDPMMPIAPGVRWFENVFSIATHWGEGHYHFPFESLVGLMSITINSSLGACIEEGRREAFNQAEAAKLKAKASGETHGCKVHVTRKDAFVLDWLKLIGGIPRQQVTFGQVGAKHLWAPLLGRCRKPWPEHVLWLQRSVLKALSNGTAAPASVIAVRRNSKRALGRFSDTVLPTATQFAKSNGLALHVHDDAQLPSIWAQLHAFSGARVVVAPLGAAQVNLLASPPGSCLVEVQQFNGSETGSLRNMDITYARLCAQLQLKYVLLTVGADRVANSSALHGAMSEGCRSAQIRKPDQTLPKGANGRMIQRNRVGWVV